MSVFVVCPIIRDGSGDTSVYSLAKCLSARHAYRGVEVKTLDNIKVIQVETDAPIETLQNDVDISLKLFSDIVSTKILRGVGEHAPEHAGEREAEHMAEEKGDREAVEHAPAEEKGDLEADDREADDNHVVDNHVGDGPMVDGPRGPEAADIVIPDIRIPPYRDRVLGFDPDDGAGERARRLINASRCDTEMDICVLLTFIKNVTKSVWLDVGKALKTVDEANCPQKMSRMKHEGDVKPLDGLKLWSHFSERHNMGGNCTSLWNDLNPGFVTIKTIHFYAQRDSPEKYRTKLFNERINCTSGSIARCFYSHFPTKYLCTSYDKKTWYVFRDGTWHEDGGVYIDRDLTQDMRGYIMTVLDELERAEDGATVRGFWLQMETDKAEYRKDLLNIIRKLETPSFVNNVMQCLRSMYYDPRFETLRDTAETCTAFANGVIDVSEGRIVVRDGKPEDFISKRSELLIPEPIDNRIERCMAKAAKYMREVFRDKELRDFVYRLICSLLYSRNREKIIAVFSGVGYNSKSVLIKIIRKILGDYAGNLPTAILTEKRTPSDGATPGLARISGCRMAIAQEPDGKDPVRTGTLKELSGGDSYPVRELYKTSVEKIPTFKMFIITNHDLVAQDADQAFWKRIVKVTFDSKWVYSGYPATYEEQLAKGIFPIREDFEDDVDDIAVGLLRIVMEKYNDYARNGLRIPKRVKDDTNVLKRGNDLVSMFISEVTTASSSMFDELHPEALFDNFMIWVHRRKYNTTMNFAEFMAGASNLLGETSIANPHGRYRGKGVWKGYKLK